MVKNCERPGLHTEHHLLNLELSDKTQIFSREKKLSKSTWLPSTRIPVTFCYTCVVINLRHMMVISVHGLYSL